MLSAWPLVVFWTVATVGLLRPTTVLLYALFVSMPFGSLAVVPPELTGGLSLTPAPVVTMLIVAKCLWSREGRRWFVSACTSPGPVASLFVFWIVAAFTTLFAPLFFAGEVEVIPVRDPADGAALLAPSLQQFSQLGYMSVSVFAVVACARLLAAQAVRQHVLRAMMAGAAVLCVTGLLDWLAQTVELDAVLGPLRTATYAIATDSRIGTLEMKRISGVSPEPAVFGSLCVTFLATLWFFRPVMRDVWMRVTASVLCAVLALMIFLSTSTTAYVGLALFLVIVMLETWWRLLVSRRRSLSRRIAWGRNRRLAAVALAIFGAFAVFPGAHVALAEAIDTVVLQKTESQSFDERSMWTSVSLQSAIDTHGFGVGLGGTRASNSFVAMLSNVGLLGTLLYVGFLAATYLLRPAKRAPDGKAWLSAYRWSLPPIIALGLMAGTTPDFGPYLALLFGSTVALQSGARTERLLARAARDARARRRRRRDGARRRVGNYLLPRLPRPLVQAGIAVAPLASDVSAGAHRTARGLAGFFVAGASPLDLGDPRGGTAWDAPNKSHSGRRDIVHVGPGGDLDRGAACPRASAAAACGPDRYNDGPPSGAGGAAACDDASLECTPAPLIDLGR